MSNVIHPVPLTFFQKQREDAIRLVLDKYLNKVVDRSQGIIKLKQVDIPRENTACNFNSFNILKRVNLKPQKMKFVK